ncbi:hypothetical protein NJ76_28440 [Rhodococcus sp. IITR03]|nr:hypothetical protein NJ76_28440 [Rhodococcus sp. IITR03]
MAEQLFSGSSHPADSVKRITRAPAMPAGEVLDASAAQVQLSIGEGDDVEPVHDRHRIFEP